MPHGALSVCELVGVRGWGRVLELGLLVVVTGGPEGSNGFFKYHQLLGR